MDKDKKTPMDLIMIGRGKPAMQEQMVLQLLRYGADADDALKKLPPVLPPHRQGYEIFSQGSGFIEFTSFLTVKAS